MPTHLEARYVTDAISVTLIDEVLRTVDAQISPFADLRGSEWYKRQMARVFVKRAIDQLN